MQKKPHKLRADLHVHSHYSEDGNMPIPLIIQRAMELDLDMIAVTDHNTVRGGLEAEALAKKTAKELLVLVGQEVLSKQGDILIYNLREAIRPHQDALDICKAAKEKGGMVIIPHPFDSFRYGLGEYMHKVLPYIDAIEGLNSRCLLGSSNKKATLFAKQYKIPMVGGSDAHFKSEIARACTLIRSKKTREDAMLAIISGRCEPAGCCSGFWPHVETFFARVNHKIKMQ